MVLPGSTQLVKLTRLALLVPLVPTDQEMVVSNNRLLPVGAVKLSLDSIVTVRGMVVDGFVWLPVNCKVAKLAVPGAFDTRAAFAPDAATTAPQTKAMTDTITRWVMVAPQVSLNAAQ